MVFQPSFMLMRIQLSAAGSSFPIKYPAFFLFLCGSNARQWYRAMSRQRPASGQHVFVRAWIAKACCYLKMS